MGVSVLTSFAKKSIRPGFAVALMLIISIPMSTAQTSNVSSGSRQSWGASVEIARDGSIIVSGGFRGVAVLGKDTLRTSPESSSGFVAKFSPDGDPVWARQYHRNGTVDHDNSVDHLALDGVLGIFALVSNYDDLSVDGADIPLGDHIFRIDGSGATRWHAAIGEDVYTLTSLAADPNGGLYVAGDAGAFEVPRAFIAHLDSAGMETWRLTEEKTEAFAQAIVADGSERLILTGAVRSEGGGTFGDVELGSPDGTIDTRVLVASVDHSGSALWATNSARSGGAPSLEINFGLDVASDTKGNIFVSGVFRDSLVFPGDVGLHSDIPRGYLLKLTSTGSIVWARSLGGSASGAARSVVVDDRGVVHVFGVEDGEPRSTPSGRISILQGFDANGNLLYSRKLPYLRVASYQNDLLALDAQGRLYVTGEAEGSVEELSEDELVYGGSEGELLVTRFSPATLLSGSDSPIRELPTMSAVIYPSPARSDAVLRIGLDRSDFISVAFYDLVGRRVGGVVSSYYETGAHEIRLDLAHLSSGMYVCRVNGTGGPISDHLFAVIK